MDPFLHYEMYRQEGQLYVQLLLLIFILSLKITDLPIQCIFSLTFIWWHRLLLFRVNLINGLPLLSFCTQNFYSLSTTILFTQGPRGWTLKVPNHYWILNHSLHIKLQMWSESQFPDYLGWVVLITSKPGAATVCQTNAGSSQCQVSSAHQVLISYCRLRVRLLMLVVMINYKNNANHK